MKAAYLINWIVFGYLGLIAFYTLKGSLAYGDGLGDLVYEFLAGLLVFSQLIVTLILSGRQKNQMNAKAFYWCGIFFLFSSLYLTWEFTFGRGGEYGWNGDVFYSAPF